MAGVKGSNTARRRKIESLKEDMKFCPVCAQKLRALGGSESEIFTCPEMHGEMKVTGSQQNSKIQMVFQYFEE